MGFVFETTFKTCEMYIKCLKVIKCWQKKQKHGILNKLVEFLTMYNCFHSPNT